MPMHARGARRSAGRAVVVAVAACAIAAALAWLWLARDDSGGPGAVPVAQPPSAAPIAAAPSAVAPEPEPEPATEPSLPHTQLPLRLVATVVRENQALSLATIEDLERDAHEVLSEGQTFAGHPKVSLARVERGRVILDNDGTREQLLLDRADRGSLADVAPYEPTAEQREYRRDVARRLREITDAGEDYLDRGERTGLLADGDVSPVYEEGELVGVRVENVRENGLYDRYGIRDGDVLTSINGVSLGSPTAAAEVLAELATSDVLKIGVSPGGNGPEEELELPVEELQGFEPPPTD